MSFASESAAPATPLSTSTLTTLLPLEKVTVSV